MAKLREQPTLHRTPQANNRLTLAYWPRVRVQLSRTFKGKPVNLGLWPRYANNLQPVNLGLWPRYANNLQPVNLGLWPRYANNLLTLNHISP
ncbi:hypothetical protein [Moorena producens]|uniref:hypothetical protein n=1 Tax=Moorena producens TaxID=1155739 RepID=UPI0011EA6F87|nr:hypothetical protein [Moorena producens]